jgi:Domain of unknown function (DUF4819)
MDMIDCVPEFNLPSVAPSKCPVYAQPGNDSVVSDLSEWKGQRILARCASKRVYKPGFIETISSSDKPVVVRLDGDAEPYFFKCGLNPDIVGDYAPAASVLCEGVQVCARPDTNCSEFFMGSICARNAANHQYLIELETISPSNTQSLWVSRANLRLLQVSLDC